MPALIVGILWLFLCVSLRAQEKLSPFTFQAEYKSDIVNNLNGGLKRGSAYVGRMDLTVQFSTASAGWWERGTFSVHGINAHGDTPSANLIGDIQPVSRIEASSRTGLFEFWFRQEFRNAAMMIGQLDLNALMATNSSSSHFINTSFGMYPSVALNTPLSIYPSATFGMYGEFRHLGNINIRTGIFDGAPLQHAENPYNVKWDGNPRAGVFYTTEVEWTEKKSERIIGTYKLGGYYSSTESAATADPTQVVTNNKGVYISIDRRVYFEKDDSAQGMNVFLQMGGSPGAQNFVTLYVCSGLTYAGLIPNRSEDIWGLGAVYSHVNRSLVDARRDQYDRHRILVEMHYKMRLGTHFSLQPDIQYVINTGADRGIANALIGIIRGSLYF